MKRTSRQREIKLNLLLKPKRIRIRRGRSSRKLELNDLKRKRRELNKCVERGHNPQNALRKNWKCHDTIKVGLQEEKEMSVVQF